MVHNGVEYGLMQAYAEGFDVFDKCEYELDNAKIAHLWGQGSVVRSWLCELAARAFEADGNGLEAIEGYTEDSGEGRWTIADATAHDVPTPVITASLYARLRSRGNGDFADRVLAALRNQFGGHAVKSAPGAQERRQERRQPPRGPPPSPAGSRQERPRRPARRPLSVAVVAGRPTDQPEPENPLTAGLERLPVAPTTLVIFGATGDLARRKLLPAIYNLAHEGALPERFHLIGVSRKEKAHEDYRAECEQAIRRFSRRRPKTTSCTALLENIKYVPGTFDDDAVYAELGRLLDEFEQEAGEPLNRAFYLSTAPSFFPVIVEELGRSRARPPRGRGGPRDHREALRHDARGGARAQPPGARHLRGDPGLPHRPLPRQGDRPEHDGVPLRQRHVRAAVEPQLHRQRADHRGRGHRHRLTRRLLRLTPARCAT